MTNLDESMLEHLGRACIIPDRDNAYKIEPNAGLGYIYSASVQDVLALTDFLYIYMYIGRERTGNLTAGLPSAVSKSYREST